ncbi:hypothetical protein TBLA_0H01100 [Henningerozyma blattae CBS 6284]|uniref:Exocyst complex component SEC5 n=1 Tax=Henningerozyma blattae (strain ATCC 34711 / CBS 6284 / DSM 70876 / NBRC 10599 / NRRL Y-10934 / UCD 77-7) TaxID=1071380 RepID=I2H7P6_HENB6|nr:hypothetical protein TBLA_0H01100 [Tetrapisispora blattae CBS 6284]CCH62398.1 hypothetical protein TBLA_0H01100 [Tetrapisispora blattae CBS 6284]
MDPFAYSQEDIQDFYNLKSLNPSSSWNEDSTNLIDLSKWQDSIPMPERSYEILKDLAQQQQSVSDKQAAQYLTNDSLKSITDPLSNEKMLTLLENHHVPDDKKLNYLINSKNFNVKAFLRDIHNTDSFETLSSSLDSLDYSLQQQSDALKNLVQQNFAKYVRVKNRLDQIYGQFSDENNNSTINSNGIMISQPNNNSNQSSSLGIDDLSVSVDQSIRATTMKLKPLIDTDKKINNFKKTKQFIEENKEFFNSPRILMKYLNNGEYNSLMLEYAKSKKLYNELENLYKGKSPKGNSTQSTSMSQKQTWDFNKKSQKVPKVIEKIKTEIENIMNLYKKQVWNSLMNDEDNTSHTFFLPLISKLLDMNAEENPIVKWIDSRLDSIETQITTTSNEMIDKIIKAQQSILRNSDTIIPASETNQNDTEEYEEDSIELRYYYSINSFFPELGVNSNKDGSSMFTSQSLTDSSNIVEMWLLILKYIHQLEGISCKFIELWEHIQNFLDGTYQSSIINEKRKDNILVGDIDVIESKHLMRLSNQQVQDIMKRGEKFVKLFTGKLLLFFGCSQETLANHTAKMATESEQPKDFGFIPPNANGLSCLRYLPKILNPLLKTTTELAQLNISDHSISVLRRVVNVLIVRCVHSISAVKLRDLSLLYKLEDWTVYETVPDLTNKNIEYGITQFPDIACSFQRLTIYAIRDILFSFERLPRINNITVTGYPSKELLTKIESKQLDSMSNVLQSVLQNAAKEKDNPRTSHTILTLTNLQYIRECTFPEIVHYYNEAFESNLDANSSSLFTLLSKMEQSIFGNYLSDLKVNIKNILVSRFNSIDWPNYTSNSFRVSDYIIEVLMLLVTVHSECFRIGPQLIYKVLEETQLFISKFLFEAFKKFIGKLSADGLLQVTVDLQFLQNVLGKLLEKDTEVTLAACLQNCFQNDLNRMNTCITETKPIVSANIARTSMQFAAFNSE